ncbi:isoprenoid synthase domain-containing protein, partial [Mycena olivaceomarginata]
LIEYANNLNIPSSIMGHPCIVSLGDFANDLVTWSNDLFSYKGDMHNMVTLLMHEHGLELQAAVNEVAMCRERIDSSLNLRSKLPSWGPSIDSAVNSYVDGLLDWIVGSLHWSYKTEM